MVVAVLRSTLIVISLGLLVACSPTRRDEVADAANPEVADAGSDAAPIAGGDACSGSPEYTPVTVTGTSPSGSLDGFHYAFALFTNGFCPDAYEIDFTPAETLPRYPEPSLRMWIMNPFSATGTNRAMAIHQVYPEAMTDNVTFEATRLDLPDATPPHIIGHFVSHEDGWSFDISVDLTSQCISTCI